MDADYAGPDTSKWCRRLTPDTGNSCSRLAGHSGEHVAHNNWPKDPEDGKWFARWSDGDTVSVKAGQVAAPIPAVQSTAVSWPTAPVSLYARTCPNTCGYYATSPYPVPPGTLCDNCTIKAAESIAAEHLKQAITTPSPSRRDLAADLLPRVLELGSAFRGDRLLFAKWEEIIRMLKKEAKP